MDEPVKKRVDESWKEQAEREKRSVAGGTGSPGGPAAPSSPGSVAGPTPAPARPGASGREPEGLPEARFDLFISGLAMETLIALGDMPHPATRKQAANLPQAKYLIDVLGILEEKTRGNLQVEERQLLEDTLYQLRMRYLSKAGPAA